MRRYYLAAMGSCGVGAAAGALVDSYSEANQSTVGAVNAGGVTGIGQCFTAIAATLGSCKFYLSKTGAPTGNAFANLYDMTGTFGSSGKPTGAALATSAAFDVSTLSGSLALITFTFSGGNQFSLVNGTHYVITFEFNGGDGSNKCAVGYDFSSPTHAGNYAQLSAGIWSASAGNDVCFYVYST